MSFGQKKLVEGVSIVLATFDRGGDKKTIVGRVIKIEGEMCEIKPSFKKYESSKWVRIQDIKLIQPELLSMLSAQSNKSNEDE